MNLLAGEVGSGKTWLALELAIAAGIGGPAWGKKAKQPTNTLYLGIDNSFNTLARRIQALVQGMEQEPPGNVYLVNQVLNIADSNGRNQLNELIKEKKAGLPRIRWAPDHP